MKILHEEGYINSRGNKFTIRTLDDAKEIITAINEYSEPDDDQPVRIYKILRFHNETLVQDVLSVAKRIANNIFVLN